MSSLFYSILVYSFFAGSILSLKDLGPLLSYTGKKKMCFSCASFHIVSRPSVQLSFPIGWVQMKPGSCTWWFFIFDCTAQRFFSDSDKKLLNQSISSLHCHAYMFSMDQNTSWIFSLMKTEFWIKSVPCDSALPGGTGCGAIFSLALIFRGFSVVLLFSTLRTEELSPLSFPWKGCGVPPSGFYGKQGTEGKG